MSSFKQVLKAGSMILDVKTQGSGGEFLRDGKSIKLSLEKIEEAAFWELFMNYYFFRNNKSYNTARKLLARAGFREKSPIEMQAAQQQYKLRIPCNHGGKAGELFLTYSPSIGRMVVRKV